jgi:hypothetical protein
LGGAIDERTRCSGALNTPIQFPQRTMPFAVSSCSGVTRKEVSQIGQRVISCQLLFSESTLSDMDIPKYLCLSLAA